MARSCGYTPSAGAASCFCSGIRNAASASGCWASCGPGTRIRRLARPPSGTDAVFRTGGLAVDLEHRRVTVDDREVHLTPTEYEMLKAFIAHPNKVLTDRMLLQQVWGSSFGAEAHYLHVYMARLRKKLEPDPQQPRYLITETGVGYRLLADE